MSAWASTRLSVSTDITHFLPAGDESSSEDRWLAELSTALARSEIGKTLILSVEGPDRATAAKGARLLAKKLAVHEDVAWVRSGTDEGLEESVRELYFDRRFHFASERPGRLRDNTLTDEALREAAASLKRELALPTSPLVRALAPRDPLMFFREQLDRLSRARMSGLTLEDDQLVTEDGRFGIVFLATKASPWHGEVQTKFLEEVGLLFEEVEREVGADLTLEESGVHRFAVMSESSIKADIARISIVSSIGIVLLFVVLFGSPRSLLLTAVPVAVGIGAGLTATALAFDRVHGLTLAFGCSLIGVCVDYAVHLLNHHAMAGGRLSPMEALRRVFPGLLLGCLTTVAGLAGLAWTSFPGIREISVLATTGVLAALAATAIVLPPFMPTAPRRTPAARALEAILGRGLDWLARARWSVIVTALIATSIIGVGLPRLEWIDALSALNQLDEEVLEADRRVRERVSRMEMGRFVVARGANLTEALVTNDRVAHALAGVNDKGAIGGYRSLHSLLFSPRVQARNVEHLRASEGLEARLDAAFVAEGFAPGAFAPFFEDLKGKLPPPLAFEELSASALGAVARPFVVEVGEETAVITFLREVRDEAALKSAIEPIEGALYFDQSAFLERAYGMYRARTLELVMAGLLLVLLLVFVRYRNLQLTLAAFVPALIAAATTLGLLGLFGVKANLMHLVALLLVLSIGVDYGVFMVEHRETQEGRTTTLLSVLVACATTILSFGLLGMSANPALASIGISVTVGVLLALVLAPAGLVVVARSPEDPSGEPG